MSQARIHWIGGPVLRATVEGDFHVHEALRVGPQKTLGEVIRVSEREIVAQVYEDTTGLRPGDVVEGTGAPLSVALGPGILGSIFDGLLRPLDGAGAKNFVRPGGFGRDRQSYPFTPHVKVGERVAPGQVFGEAQERNRVERCMVPHDVEGEIVTIVSAGEYADDEALAMVKRDDGTEADLTMVQYWPVRRARPVARREMLGQPLITGQRVIDMLFPVALGGRAMLPGGFGTGKTVLQETLAKWSDADVIIYVGCGERGNEMAEVLHEFAKLEDPRTGRALMERTAIIANTSNMPVAAREASIYTGITVAEYFRDQGLNVALMADSTSRWAEALREVSGRLGELPGEGGYPAYISSRLAEFYERAGRVKTLDGDDASLTVVGTVSPPAGDFSEPVTTHSKRYVRCFWGLDRIRAQARFYPAIDPLQSYSEDAPRLAEWWRTKGGNPDWQQSRQKILTLLDEEARIERLARIVGKDALPAEQQIVLLYAEMINEGLLRQLATSPVDRYCSPTRQTHMIRLIMHFIERAEQAMLDGVTPQVISNLATRRLLQRMGEELGEDRLDDYKDLWRAIDEDFAALSSPHNGGAKEVHDAH
ncbi:V-type ATP synthase subunit A [Magnetovibrio sp.]|uniref:V-type ATP synthase subunit A n=1 Tax=Magnetovibrio sp. TaxID=2024836 RepID=UPI002F955159